MIDTVRNSIKTRPWDGHAFAVGALLVAALLAFPFLVDNRFLIGVLFSTLMFVTLATSWNILSGYTGYISFGHAAFFGIGAYTCAILFGEVGLPIAVAIGLAGVVTVALSLPIATATIRLSDVYFAIMMLVFSELLLAAAENFDSLTGGVRGMVLPIGDYLTYMYLLMLGLTVVSILTSYAIARSHVGLALTAIREDEEAADSLGLHTTKYKVLAFSISALYPGIAGAIAAIYWAYIDPSSVFDVILSGDMMIMSVLGGMGTVAGPILGAAVINPLTMETQAQYPYFHGIVFGLLFMILVLAMPEGVVPTFQGSRFRDRIVAALPGVLVPDERADDGTGRETAAGPDSTTDASDDGERHE